MTYGIESNPVHAVTSNGDVVLDSKNVPKDKDYIYSGRKSFSVWMDWTEWQQVYHAFFSNELRSIDNDMNSMATADHLHQNRNHDDVETADNDAILNALARVAAWRARSDLPVAIEATAQLVEINCHDHAYGLATPGRSMYRSHEELRLLYAATIIRCVNGLVDASQKGAYAMAISALAMRIGIPLWIVDIRHEAAHTKLPSLPTLQLAAQSLRQWLFEHYWQPQNAAVQQRVVRVGGILKRYFCTTTSVSDTIFMMTAFLEDSESQVQT
jgi:hypothetical protein